MPNKPDDPRAQLVKVLMDKVKTDPFPSITMMNTIEEMLTPDELPQYAQILMDKLADENFPSVTMVSRLRDLIS